MLPSDRPLQALLVDDEPTALDVLRLTLEASGMRCNTAADGFDALKALRHSAPDVIVTDLRMPKMSGFELLPIIRRRYPQMGIVVISAEPLDHDQQLQLPMHAYLRKGEYTSDQLVATIRTVASTLSLQMRYFPQGSNINWPADEKA